MKYLKIFESLNSMDILMKFINSNDRSKWIIIEGKMDVYIRKSKRSIDGELINFIDLANFNIPNDKNKRKGLFTRFLLECDKLDMNLYIENVLNSDIIESIKRLGYEKCNEEGHGSFYKLKK